jgi:hypothetical protein
LSELSLAQSVVSRLRLDRDEWRSTTQVQERQLLAHGQELEHQDFSIKALEDRNVALQAGHGNVVSANNKLFTRLQDATASNDALVGQLKDADRRIARLTKSDRAKGKVWQRNLGLKTMLDRQTLQTASSTSQQDASTEAALSEALALAIGRIEELEDKGNALLDVIDRRNNNGGNDEDAHNSTAKLLEVEIAFRGVLEDEAFNQQN